jgi:outer membrane autotransporter protein
MTGVAAGGHLSNVITWGQVFGSTADQDDRGGINGFDLGYSGFTLGMDSLVTENLRLGAALSYSITDVKTKGLDNRTDISSYQMTLYGSLYQGAYYFDGSLSYMLSNNDSNRFVTINNFSRAARADYSSDQIIAQGTFGRDFALENNLIVNPYVGLEYVGLSTDSYRERGAGTLNLGVNSENTAALTSTIGVSIRKHIETSSDYHFMPEVYIGWRHDLLDETQVTTSSFSGGGAAFNTRGLDPADSSINIGGTLSVYSSSAIEIQGKYDFETKSGYQSHSGTLLFRYRF